MSRAAEGSDAGGDRPEDGSDQEILNDDLLSALGIGDSEDRIKVPAPEEKDLEAISRRPEAAVERISERISERPLDDWDEGAADRAELAACLVNMAGAGNRAFTAGEQAEIRREIGALRAEVGTLTELSRRQQEAIGQLLAEVQGGSERMGRKDWVTYAIGAATSLVIMEIVPPLVLLPLAVHAVHALVHLLILDA